MNMRINVGEVRHAKIEVFSIKKDVEFNIDRASYELIRKDTGKTEAEGTCGVEGHLIDVVIQPKFSGFYILKIIYSILNEKFIEHIEINVKE